MAYDITIEIPLEISKASKTLSKHFKSKNISEWRVLEVSDGGAYDRGYEDGLVAHKTSLKAIEAKLTAQYKAQEIEKLKLQLKDLMRDLNLTDFTKEN